MNIAQTVWYRPGCHLNVLADPGMCVVCIGTVCLALILISDTSILIMGIYTAESSNGRNVGI